MIDWPGSDTFLWPRESIMMMWFLSEKQISTVTTLIRLRVSSECAFLVPFCSCPNLISALSARQVIWNSNFQETRRFRSFRISSAELKLSANGPVFSLPSGLLGEGKDVSIAPSIYA